MITVQTPIKVDAKKTLPVGARADLSAFEEELGALTVQKLLNCGALVETNGEAMPPATTGTSADPRGDGQSELAQIFGAMLLADPEQKNEAWWTKDGRPEVAELNKRLANNITAQERDGAWAARPAAS